MEPNVVINQLIIGLGLGCVYGLIGLSFNGIYDSSKIVNFAQGEFSMVGAIMASVATAKWGLSLPFAIPVLVACAIVSAWVVQYLIVEPLLKRQAGLLSVIIGTMAVSLIIEGFFGWWIGFAPQPTARYVDPYSLKWGSIVVAKEYLVIICTTAGLTFVYWLFLQRTRWGLALRATGQNAIGAVGVGIPARRVRNVAFAISASVAAIGGFLIGPLIGVSVFMGFNLLIYGFIASVIGGIGRPYAALVGGIILGMSTSFMGTVKGYLVTPTNMIVLILVLLAKPHGLLSRQTEARR